MSNKNSTHCYHLGVDTVTGQFYTGSFTKIIARDQIVAAPAANLHNTASLTNIQFGEYLGVHTPKSGSENFKLTSEITSSLSLLAGQELVGTPHILSFTIEHGSNSVLAYTDGNFGPISSSGEIISTT